MIKCNNLNELRAQIAFFDANDCPDISEIFAEVSGVMAHQYFWADDEDKRHLDEIPFDENNAEVNIVCETDDYDKVVSEMLGYPAYADISHNTLGLSNGEYLTIFNPHTLWLYVPKRLLKEKRWRELLSTLPSSEPVALLAWELS